MHRLDVRTKMALFLTSVFVAALWCRFWGYGVMDWGAFYVDATVLLGLLLVSVLVCLLSNLKLNEIPIFSLGWIYLCVFTVSLTSLSFGKISLLGPLRLEGLINGVVCALFLSVTYTLSKAIITTTNPKDFVQALIKMRVPYNLAFGCIFSLRLIPFVFRELNKVLLIQRLRDVKPTFSTFPGYLRRTIYALTVCLLKSGREFAMTMEIRGFTSGRKRTHVEQLRMGSSDYLLSSLFLVVCVAAVAIKVIPPV